tara:strand:- start:176 stop:469 length:294 start_codon:yes stop_codon:yes gene_type:complete
MITISDALQSLKPKAQFAVRGDVIEWLDTEQTQPSQSEIDAEVIRLQAEYDAKEYQRKRKKEYPTIQELVVALYDTDDKVAIDAKRAAVKAKYPKGE